jgi:hypothetical protein
MSLDSLLQRTDVWRGGVAPPQAGLASGYAALDARLAGGGWPRGAVSELLFARAGIGELALVVPALARLSREGRWLVLVAPPYVPYAPALTRAGVDLARAIVVEPRAPRDALWVSEQALRAGACGAVLLWKDDIEPRALRRLQLAAETGGGLGMLFRSLRRVGENSPAALRLRLKGMAGHERRLEIAVLKRRGGWPTGPIIVEVDHVPG